MIETPINPALLTEHNPTGRNVRIGNKPRGVRRINPIGLAIGGTIFVTAVLLGTLSFNQNQQTEGDQFQDTTTAAPVRADKHDNWYTSVPDTPPQALPDDPLTASHPPESPPASPPSAKGPLPTLLLAPGGKATDSTAAGDDDDLGQSARAPLAATGFAELPLGPASMLTPNTDLLKAPAPVIPQISLPTAPSEDANQQNNKDQFLAKAQANSPDYNPSGKTTPLSPYELKAGSVVPAVLINGINSDLPGAVIAQVRENVFDTATGRFLLIPQGARLFGKYDSHVTYGQSRVLIAWQRIIYPDGTNIDLHGMPGGDVSGYAGFEDEVDNHYLRIFGAAVMMSAISAGAELSQPQATTTTAAPTAGQTASAALGQQLSQTGAAITQKNLQLQPTLEIRPGYLFVIMVTADLVLPPAIKTQGRPS